MIFATETNKFGQLYHSQDNEDINNEILVKFNCYKMQ